LSRFLFFFLSCLAVASASAQHDTTVTAFKKLFKKRIVRPYYAVYNKRDFRMDSLRARGEEGGYIRFKVEVLPGKAEQRVPAYLCRRFIELDTLRVLESGDTVVAEFYNLETVINNRQLFGLIIERQWVANHYRGSEKFLCTFDKRFRPLDVVKLASSIPPDGSSVDNFNKIVGSFERLPWFIEESEGALYKDMTMSYMDPHDQLIRYRVNLEGRIVRVP
jgi:hypothetical protein